MLILSRKTGESIIIKIGDKEIKMTLVEINNGSIKLGFEAARDIKIYRDEVYQEIVNQNKASVISDIDLAKEINKKINLQKEKQKFNG
ncbi:carbon storage regulator [Petrotoga sp. 9PWA.NaAc.5.4]|uniref:carbon storage regulator n=1 Tax=Petrotoga sp. 9PWA.NaAc.5.4 TaxID=1434328 RepID=UPI000CB08F12|nr:carbon storage regulator [Petrotoga sp. 9PWA.NaAc.5.4]PNR94729.1 hypothetical protein X924_05555 [Petrotoga sp. 9PWA.NaAc.5.4]